MIGQPLLLELLFLTDCTTSGTMWATSRLAPPTILVNWPVTRFTTGGIPMARYLIMEQTRFCSDCDGAPSNSSPYYIFTQDLQALVNELAIEIPIPNYPPYTSKYNPHISPYFSPVSGSDF
jgi:hypothetical protein